MGVISVFSTADIAVLGGLIFASPIPEECVALHAWHARMDLRPSVQAWRAMVAQGGLNS